ncbi:MAG: 2-dehydropantoate 2-reductase [Campylobacterales bacterium]|nr:2-dehydropantoate 2-reductase [Campylobacterales bacterium]
MYYIILQEIRGVIEMRIAVVGLGGVGGYIAAHLAKTSHEVIGFARGEHLRKIQNDGITIIEDDTSWHPEGTSSLTLTAHVKLKAQELKEAEGYFDIVLFCVKSYDLKSSYEAISSHVDEETIILSLANGVEHGDELRVLSECKVLDACVYILSHVQEAGVIRKKGKVFALIFGGLQEESKILKAVCDEASLRAKVEEDSKTAIWKKYIFISAFATATAFYDNTIGYVYEHHYEEVKTLLQEIAEVAHAKGVNIYDEVEKSLEIAKNLPYDSSTSMHLDFQNRRRDELKTLSGYIVKEAKREFVEVPFMQKMYGELLKRHKE